jgi:hypothetical protein
MLEALKNANLVTEDQAKQVERTLAAKAKEEQKQQAKRDREERNQPPSLDEN